MGGVGADRAIDQTPSSMGGRDAPSNMQWLPREQHKEKTSWSDWGRTASGRGSEYQ